MSSDVETLMWFCGTDDVTQIEFHMLKQKHQFILGFRAAVKKENGECWLDFKKLNSDKML
jgi:hypothetical protein